VRPKYVIAVLVRELLLQAKYLLSQDRASSQFEEPHLGSIGASILAFGAARIDPTGIFVMPARTSLLMQGFFCVVCAVELGLYLLRWARRVILKA
jgi:hypothetical protein